MNDAWNGTGYQFGGGDWAINGVVIHFEAGWRQGFWNDADGDGLPDELDPCVNDPSNNSAWWGGGSWAIDGIWRTFPGQFHGTNVADSDGDGIPDDLDPLPNDSTNNSFWWNGGTYTIGGQTCHFDARYYQGSGLDSDGDGIPDGADPYATDSLNGSTRYWQGGDWVVNNGNGTTALHYEPGQYLESLNWGDSDNDGLPDGLDPFPDDCFNGNYFTLNGGSYMANNQPVYYGMGTYGGVWSDRDGDSIPDVVDVLPDDPYNGNDSDGDGIPDSVEARVHLLNGSVADSGDVRFVNGETDGLTWLQAYQNGIPLDQLLDPALDSDHDGMSDLYEILNGLARSSPNDAADAPVNHMFNASGQRDSTGAVMNDFILNVEKARAGLPLNTVIDDAQTYESLTGHPPGAGITQNDQLDVTENDWDGDGVSNVDEVLVFGTDPRDASSRASVEELLAAYQLNRTSLTTNASFAALFASGSEESGGSGSSGADVPDPDLGGLSLNSLGGLAAASLAQAGLPSTTTSAATGSGPPKPLPGTGSADVKFQVRWVEVELIEGEYQHAPQGAAGWIDHGEESTPRYEFQSQVWQSATRGLASRWSTSVSAGQADVSAPQAAAHLNDLEKLPWRDATSGDDMHLTSFDASGEAVPVPEMSMTSPDGLQQAGTAYVQGHYRRVRKVEVRLMARNRLDAPVSRTFVLPCLIRDTAGNGANPQTEAAVARVQVGQDGATDIPAGTASSTGETDGQPNQGIIRPTSKEDPATAKAKDRDLLPVEISSADRLVTGSVPDLWDGMGLEFASKSGTVLGRYENISAAMKSSSGDGQNFHIYGSKSEIFDADEADKIDAENIDPKRFDSRVVFYKDGGKVKFMTVFDDLGDIEVRILKDGSQKAKIDYTLEADQPTFEAIVQLGRSVAQVNHLPQTESLEPATDPYTDEGDEDDGGTKLPVLAANLPDPSGNSSPQPLQPFSNGQPMALSLPASATFSTQSSVAITLAKPAGLGQQNGTLQLTLNNPSAVKIYNSEGTQEIQNYAVNLSEPTGDLAQASTEQGMQVRVQGVQANQTTTLTWQYLDAFGAVRGTSSLPLQVTAPQGTSQNATPALDSPTLGTPASLPQSSPSAPVGYPLPSKAFGEVPQGLQARVGNIVAKLIGPMELELASTGGKSWLKQKEAQWHLRMQFSKGFGGGFSTAINGEISDLGHMVMLAGEINQLTSDPIAAIKRGRQLYDALRELSQDINDAGGIKNYVNKMVDAMKEDVEQSFDWLNAGYISDDNDAFILGYGAGYGTETVAMFAAVNIVLERGVGAAAKAVRLIKQGRTAFYFLLPRGKFEIRMLMWPLRYGRLMQLTLGAGKDAALVYEEVCEVTTMVKGLAKTASPYGTQGGSLEVLAKRYRRVDELAKQLAKTNRKVNCYGDWLRSEHVLRELATFSEAMGAGVTDAFGEAGVRGAARMGQSMCVRDTVGGIEKVHTDGIRAVRNYLAKEHDWTKLPAPGSIVRADAEQLCALFDEGTAFALQPDGQTWIYNNALSYGPMVNDANALFGEQHRIAHVLHHTFVDTNRATHSVFAGSPHQVFETLDHAWATRNGSSVLKKLATGGARNDVYRIPWAGAGINAGEDYIWIVLKKGTNEVITAFPVTASKVP